MKGRTDERKDGMEERTEEMTIKEGWWEGRKEGRQEGRNIRGGGEGVDKKEAEGCKGGRTPSN